MEAGVGIGRLDRHFVTKMAHFYGLLKPNRSLLGPTGADWPADVFADSAQRLRMLKDLSSRARVWKAVGLEDAGKEVEVGQEGFAGVKPCAGAETVASLRISAGLVCRHSQAIGQARRGGIALPEGTVIAGLPAFGRFGSGFVAGVGSQFVFDRPVPDAGTVGFEFRALASTM